jgi:hypothetical protein
LGWQPSIKLTEQYYNNVAHGSNIREIQFSFV